MPLSTAALCFSQHKINFNPKWSQQYQSINYMLEYINTNPSGFLTVVAALLGGLFGFNMYRKNKTREYRVQLFETLHPYLNRLLQTDDDCRLFLNDEALKKHEIAVNNLMAHVDFIERSCLKRKWYRLGMVQMDKNHYMPDYSQYADCGFPDKRRKIRPVIIKRIRDVIAFANK
jgi:hypothetical protein